MGKPSCPVISKHDYEVREIHLSDARILVEEYHYAAGASNTRVYTHGLFDRSDGCPVGVAWWIPPTKSAALATFPQDWRGVLALSRLVVAPWVPQNGASFLMSRSMRLIDRGRWPCLVTYADVWRGHSGTIYKAANWKFVGMTKPERVYTIEGRMTARKAGPRTYRHNEMLARGAVLEGSFPKLKFVHIV